MADSELKLRPAKAGKGRAAGIVLVAAAFGGGAAAGGVGAVMAFASLPGKAAPTDRPSPHLDYVDIDNAFTTNLVDTGRFLQLRIAVSTTGGPPTVAALTAHKLAVVSAVLNVLGDLSEADVAGALAKARLRKRLREAIDAVLAQKAHVAGIDEVFLTSLVVQ